MNKENYNVSNLSQEFQADVEFDVARDIHLLIQKIAKKLGFADHFSPDIRPADPRFGDFQANGVLAYAKKIQKNPRDIAQILLDGLKEDPICSAKYEVSIAGPGFINFLQTSNAILSWLQFYKTKEALMYGAKALYRRLKQVDSTDSKKIRVVVDYSSPNTAKQMHVGHLRSMVIGEAIQRMLGFCGVEVIRDNHIGDWGTQFGILIMAIKNKKIDIHSLEGDVLSELESLYKEGNDLCKNNPAFLEMARKELVMLQQGDPINMHLWEKIKELSYNSFQEIYDIFNVKFDCVLGESFYRDKVDRVINELKDLRIAQDSQGAWVVFHPEHPRFSKQPFIILKSDGATNYATTDLATALYRLEHFKAQEMIVLTDSRQRDHFEQLELTVNKWFKEKNYGKTQLIHAWFGSVLGKDGKAIKTRSGEPVKLKELVKEAIERAYTIICLKNPSLSENEKQTIARVVGIGAVRYADLSQNRTSDYVFDWDKLLSFEGNTAPYLLYAVVRIRSIFKKANIRPDCMDIQSTPLQTQAELQVAKKLIEFPSVLTQSLLDLKPHFLCTYLHELASIFSSFYSTEKVMVDETPIRERRLLLCASTLLFLEMGLGLLGIETLESM